MRKKLMNKKLVLCISAIILIILGITVINNINKKEDGITAKIIIETINKISKASNWLKITCFYVIILVMLRKNEYNNQR